MFAEPCSRCAGVVSVESAAGGGASNLEISNVFISHNSKFQKIDLPTNLKTQISGRQVGRPAGQRFLPQTIIITHKSYTNPIFILF